MAFYLPLSPLGRYGWDSIAWKLAAAYASPSIQS